MLGQGCKVEFHCNGVVFLLYQANGAVKDETEDPFDDPDDEWVDDFVLDSPTSNTRYLFSILYLK